MMTFTQASTTIPIQSLLEKFSDEITLITGDPTANLSGLGHPTSAKPTELITLSDEAHVQMAQDSKSLIWMIPAKIAKKLSPKSGVVVLAAESPKLMMAKIAKAFFRPTAHFIPVGSEPISPDAIIDTSAEIGKNVIIGPGAVIGKNCKIKEGAIIGALSVLENGCEIGEFTHIHPHVFLAFGTQVGNHSEIKPSCVIGGEGFGYVTDMKKGEHYRVTHFGRVVIGDFVHIGAGVQIDRGTFEDSRIGDHVKIDNHCHFGHNVNIGRGSIMVGGVLVAGSVQIGKYCVIGGRTTIAGHLKVADHVHIAGMSGVTKSILVAGQYGGHPIQSLSDHLKTQSSLRKVPELRKTIQRILKNLSLSENGSKD